MIDRCKFTVAVTVIVLVLLASPAGAQGVSWEVLGDTSGGPTGCATAAIEAIDGFARGMRTADSVVLDSAFAREFIFSTGKWAPADTFVRLGTVSELVAYARRRMPAQERLTIRSVQFNY